MKCLGCQSNPEVFGTQKNEYRVYLALIFLAALPFCTVIWAYRLIRHMTLPTLGPIQSAISEARTITPRIFQT
ncbi:cytochrome PufQ [Planktomarina temperata]|nr:cytochrome PufQ [Planktomarina temperata]